MQATMTALRAILGEFAPASPYPTGAGGQTATLETLTLVVDDVGAARAALAAYLGRPGRAVEPSELDEAGLAQSFDVGPCHLLIVEPGSGTDAEAFLLAHGPGLYRLAVRGSAVAPTAARQVRRTMSSLLTATPRHAMPGRPVR